MNARFVTVELVSTQFGGKFGPMSHFKFSKEVDEALESYVNGEDMYALDKLCAIGFFDDLFNKVVNFMQDDFESHDQNRQAFRRDGTVYNLTKKTHTRFLHRGVKDVKNLEILWNKINYFGLVEEEDRKEAVKFISKDLMSMVSRFINKSRRSYYSAYLGKGMPGVIYIGTHDFDSPGMKGRVKKYKALLNRLFEISRNVQSIPDEYLASVASQAEFDKNMSDLRAAVEKFREHKFHSQTLQQAFVQVVKRFDILDGVQVSPEDSYFVDEAASVYIPEAISSLGRLSGTVDTNLLNEAESVLVSQFELLCKRFDRILQTHDLKVVNEMREQVGFLKRIIGLK